FAGPAGRCEGPEATWPEPRTSAWATSSTRATPTKMAATRIRAVNRTTPPHTPAPPRTGIPVHAGERGPVAGLATFDPRLGAQRAVAAERCAPEVARPVGNRTGVPGRVTGRPPPGK